MWGEHPDLTCQTRKIRGSVTDPTQQSGSSGALTAPFSIQQFCQSPVETHTESPTDSHSVAKRAHQKTFDRHSLMCPGMGEVLCRFFVSVSQTFKMNNTDHRNRRHHLEGLG